MAQRLLLKADQWNVLLSAPADAETLIRHYTLGERELDLVRAKTAATNQLGLAIQLCHIRHLGRPWLRDESLPPKVVAFVAQQLEVMPYCDSQAMNEHLNEISAQVEPGHHAVVLLDQAGWHISQVLRTPANMTLLPLPAKAPELNPVENLWQLMRDNYLSNRIFQNYDDIVDHCCEAWNKIADQPWRIMSIGLRDWAQGY